MPQIVLIAYNLRSTHNVGSLLRTADGLGVEKVYLAGYTPYPTAKDDDRLPHLSNKIGHKISKTALGAEKTVAWEHSADISHLIGDLKMQGYLVTALEQTSSSIPLSKFKPPAKIAVVVGPEVEGLGADILAKMDAVIEIPMKGAKESFNVAVAAAIALYAVSQKLAK